MILAQQQSIKIDGDEIEQKAIATFSQTLQDQLIFAKLAIIQQSKIWRGYIMATTVYSPRKQHTTVQAVTKIIIQFFERNDSFSYYSVFPHRSQQKLAQKIWSILSLLKQRGAYNPITGRELADHLGEQSVSNLRSLIKEIRPVIADHGYLLNADRRHGYFLVKTQK